MRRPVLRCVLWFAIGGVAVLSHSAQAEYYVAGQVGVNFADRLKDIQGTGSLVTVAPRFENFDLKNAVLYGAKLGFFPGNGPINWMSSTANRTLRGWATFPASICE